jgi:hypothetical protein
MKYISKRYNLPYYILGEPIEDSKYGVNLHLKFPDDIDQEILQSLILTKFRMERKSFIFKAFLRRKPYQTLLKSIKTNKYNFRHNKQSTNIKLFVVNKVDKSKLIKTFAHATQNSALRIII